MFQLIETVGNITRPLVLTTDLDIVTRMLDDYGFEFVADVLGIKQFSHADGRTAQVRVVTAQVARASINAVRQDTRRVCSHCGGASFVWAAEWSGVYCRLCSGPYVGSPSGRPRSYWEATYKLAAHRESMR